MTDPWTAPLIFDILGTSDRPSSDGKLIIKLQDVSRHLALGFGSDGRAVFAAPQRGPMSGFKTASAELLLDQQLELEGFKGIKLFVLKIDVKDEATALGFAGVLSGFVQLADRDKLEDAVASLKDFLRSEREVGESMVKAQIGLAGELAFIMSHHDVGAAIRAWHFDPTGTYDFGFRSARVEVKTTLRPIRKHWLKYTQFGPSRHRNLYLVSVYTGLVDRGETLPEVVDKLRKGLKDADALEFDAKVSSYDLPSFKLRFDMDSAVAGLRFYEAVAIPTPLLNDDSITDLNWQIDFDKKAHLQEPPQL